MKSLPDMTPNTNPPTRTLDALTDAVLTTRAAYDQSHSATDYLAYRAACIAFDAALTAKERT